MEQANTHKEMSVRIMHGAEHVTTSILYSVRFTSSLVNSELSYPYYKNVVGRVEMHSVNQTC